MTVSLRRIPAATPLPLETPPLPSSRPASGADARLNELLSPAVSANVQRALHSARQHLGMDVAFISEFVGDRRMFHHIDAPGGLCLAPGDSLPLTEGYCQSVVDGLLPELIADTSHVPAAMAIPATQLIPIGSHLSVPLRMSDGRVYGTFCCFSHKPDPSLNQRDLGMLRMFAEQVAHQIDADLQCSRGRSEKTERIRSLFTQHAPSMVYQPIYRLSDMAIVGAESLSRFSIEPRRPPDQWFSEAAEVGLQTPLELRAIRNALDGYQPVWQSERLYLGVNSSASTVIDGGLDEAFDSYPRRHLMLEITEHDLVEDYDRLVRALAPLRAQGIQVAIDDAGSGYASMRHILNIDPDVIKLDMSLTRAIDFSAQKRAMASALIEFGRQTDCRIVAEGVETAGEMETLRVLGVHAAQGYYLGRPVPMEDFRRLLA